MERKKLLLISIILISLIIRLIISWVDVRDLTGKILLDDAFIYFSISRSIALGNGITYNGVDPTNGFQPLWAFTLVPVFLITKYPNLAVNLVSTIASIIDTLTIFLIYKIAQKKFNENIGLLSATFWGLNPLIIFQTLDGGDVSIYVLFILSTIFYYISLNGKLKYKNSIILGILLGLTILARMDGIFLAMAVILHIVWSNKKNINIGIKKSITTLILTSLVLSPWFIWSYFTFGTIVQSSAVAKYYMNHGIFPYFDLKEPKNLSETIKMITENIIRTIGSITHQLGIVDFNLNFITIIISLFLLVTLLFSLKAVKKMNVYVLFSVLLTLFYDLYLWGINIRYLTPVIPLLIILVSYGFYNLVIKIKKSNNLVAAIFVLFLLVLFNNGIIQWERGYSIWQLEIYDDALWLKNNTAPNDIIASFGAGAYMFFSDRRVINLDGVINFDALEALRNKSVINYAKSKNATIWIDSIYLNQTFVNGYLNGRKINILKENNWVDFLGEGKDKLELINQREGIYKSLRGFNMLVVFFKARIL
jgi:hypothetical protein